MFEQGATPSAVIGIPFFLLTDPEATRKAGRQCFKRLEGGLLLFTTEEAAQKAIRDFDDPYMKSMRGKTPSALRNLLVELQRGCIDQVMVDYDVTTRSFVPATVTALLAALGH